jgi:hypothetical protein
MFTELNPSSSHEANDRNSRTDMVVTDDFGGVVDTLDLLSGPTVASS